MIDSMVMLHAKHHQYNLQMVYIDYQQAFPLVQHAFLCDSSFRSCRLNMAHKDEVF